MSDEPKDEADLEPTAQDAAADAPAPEEKPKRRRRAKKAAPAAEEPVAEDAAAEEPKKPRRRRARKAVAEEPVAEEPVDEEPVVEEPVVEEPVVEEPVAEEPVAEEPVAEEPVAEEPVAAEPATGDRAAAAKKPAAEKPAARAKPAAKAPANGGAPPVVRAHAKYVRTSARKARMVCDVIRGKSVEEARAILAHAPRQVATDWSKLLESAVANAEHNHELIGDELKIVAVFADEGPTLKRFRPRAMGRAAPIRKRTSHLTIQLTPKENH